MMAASEMKKEGVDKMELKRSGSQPSQKGPEEYFTGSVRVDPLSQAHEPSRVSSALVTFEPGARSAWHWHPLGQTLIVTQGCGWVQSIASRHEASPFANSINGGNANGDRPNS